MNEIETLDERGGWTSASNAPADALCAGRHLAQKGLPDIVTSDSKFGDRIHAALAGNSTIGLTGEELSVFEGCTEIRDKLIMEKFGMDASKAKWITEQRFWWKSTDGKHKHSGKVDLLVVLGTEALLIEYKTLPGEVEGSATNEQLRDQVALAAGNLKLTEVDVAVVQPLVTYSPAICRYDTTSITKSQLEMVQRIRNSNEPNAKRTAGVLQCKYCKARFTCKEYSAFTALATPVAMNSLTVPVHQWTPEQRALFCERLPIAQKWLDECKAQIKDMLRKEEKAVPGWKLAPGDIRRTITNPEELHNRFIAMGGTTQQFLACVEIGKGKLEVQIREIAKLKGKALKAKMEEIQLGITEDKQTDSSLAIDR